jgi:hypothetical protein
MHRQCYVASVLRLTYLLYFFGSYGHSSFHLLHAPQGLLDLSGGQAHIGIKRMGELDVKAFSNACRGKLSEEDAEVTAAILCSKWEAEIRNPEWHPFRVIMVGGKHMVRIFICKIHCL